MSEPTLRPFETADTDACYEICLRTADNGGDASHLHADRRIVGEVWVAPYLVRHPECAFVVEDDEGVGGYIVGAPNTAAYDRWAAELWFPPLRDRYPKGTFPEGTADAACVNLIHTPPVMPAERVAGYPAHLHINQLPRLQGRGFGKQLMNRLFAVCRTAGAQSIHLGCSPANTRAITFYQRLGFEDLLGGFLWGRSTEHLS